MEACASRVLAFTLDGQLQPYVGWEVEVYEEAVVALDVHDLAEVRYVPKAEVR